MDSKLPYNMITEILLRTSLNTLDAVRCTNKELNKLTYESYFLEEYKKRNNIVSGFLLQNFTSGLGYTRDFVSSHESNNLDLGFLPSGAKICAASEQGLIVYKSLFKYYVCKPTTKQVLVLPRPMRGTMCEWMAIVVVGSKPLHYKIFRLSTLDEPEMEWTFPKYVCEIFDSKKWEWRPLDLVKFPPPVVVRYTTPSVTTGGSIYLLLNNNHVFKFDAYSERWTTFSSPGSHYSKLTPREVMRLLKYKGKLALVCKGLDYSCPWEIWVARMDGSWKKTHVFDDKGIGRLSLIELFDDTDKSVMMNYGKKKLYMFKKDSKSISEFVLRYPPHEMLTFRSDFEPVDLSSR